MLTAELTEDAMLQRLSAISLQPERSGANLTVEERTMLEVETSVASFKGANYYKKQRKKEKKEAKQKMNLLCCKCIIH